MYKKEEVCPYCGHVRLVSKYKKRITRCVKCKNIGRVHSVETNTKNSIRNSGENNPFFGKSHTEESKSKIGKYIRSEQQIEDIKELLSKYSNKRSFIDIWREKYGDEEAEIRLIEFKKKQSELHTGNKNSMYGKPSPCGSGNGWSGWIDGIYFRSILELSYIVYMIDNNISFETGELKKHSVEYDGKNYYPDFYLIYEDLYIEVKPKRLTNTSINLKKFNAARLYYGDRFKIVTEDDIKVLGYMDIYKLYVSGRLKWIDRYQNRFDDLYKEVFGVDLRGGTPVQE